MADQLTLFYPWGKDYAQLITTRPRRHGFSDLPKDLLAITSVGFGAVLAFLVLLYTTYSAFPAPIQEMVLTTLCISLFGEVVLNSI